MGNVTVKESIFIAASLVSPSDAQGQGYDRAAVVSVAGLRSR
jgi:hypothetical protein